MHCNIKRFWHIFDACSKTKTCSINAHKNYHFWQYIRQIKNFNSNKIFAIFSDNSNGKKKPSWKHKSMAINLKKKPKKLLIVLLHSRISVIECYSPQLWPWHIWCREESFRSSISSPPVCGSRTAPTVSLLYLSPWI